MKFVTTFMILMSLSISSSIWDESPVLGNESVTPQNDKQASDKLIYADFEKVENGRAVSNGGGLVQIYAAQESTPVKFKGLANVTPGTPELVRGKDGGQNHFRLLNTI